MEELELARNRNETRKFYHSLNQSRKEFKPKTNMCRKENGDIVSSEDEILERWANYFGELLGGEREERNIVHTYENTQEVREPDLEDIKRATERLKSNKSPGSDGIVAELLKAGSDVIAEVLYKIIFRIWTEERMPQEWHEGIICPIHKKGDRLECRNYRGITLLNVAYKILSNIICDRIKPYAEEVLGEYQCGFRPNRSTINQIFNLRQILEKTTEFGIDTYHLFIDFKAAYDSILRGKLYQAMNQMKVPKKLIDITKMTMSKVVCAVKIQNSVSRKFETERGLRQGDALACLLFNIAMEKVVRDAKLNQRGNIFYKSTQLLAYADDVDIITRDTRQVKENLNRFVAAAADMGLEINEGKTKLLASTVQYQNRIGLSMEIGNYDFEVVPSFVYLGSMVTDKNDMTSEIQRRILRASKCYYGLLKHFRSSALSRVSKIRIYKTLILPVLIYGSETWTLSKPNEQRLHIFERKILRRIFGAVNDNGQWRQRYNFELYQIYKEVAGGTDIITTIKLGRLRWAGHVVRAGDNSMIRNIFDATPTGTRRRGRPCLRWRDGIAEDAKRLDIGNWRRASQDRLEWRRLLREARVRTGL